jgi:4-carboxymuconolactone decarboxylase
MTNREAGINVIREMMGDPAAANLSASADSNIFGAPIAAYAVDQVSADIWTRPGLDRRSRNLVAMSVMIAMRQPHEFAIHMGAGLNNGLTVKEIEEVLIQALPYVGYSAIATALAAAAEVIKGRGLDSDENYTGHRGLL